MSPIEWAGVGVFVVGLVLAALGVGLWRVTGPAYAILLLLEAVALSAAGLGVAFNQLPIPLHDNQPLVVSGALGAVGLWHVVMIGRWPLPKAQR